MIKPLKEDFDKYCIDQGRKPFSVRWFVQCIQQLIDIKILVIHRRYRGHGYKVQAYHPWQINPPNPEDPNLIKNFKRKNKNSDNSSKTSSNAKKNSKKQGSNDDFSSPSYRENRETKQTVVVPPENFENLENKEVESQETNNDVKSLVLFHDNFYKVLLFAFY